MWTTGCHCRFVFLLRSVSVSEVPAVGPVGYRYWVGCVLLYVHRNRRLIKLGTGAQDFHLHVHTAPELSVSDPGRRRFLQLTGRCGTDRPFGYPLMPNSLTLVQPTARQVQSPLLLKFFFFFFSLSLSLSLLFSSEFSVALRPQRPYGIFRDGSTDWLFCGLL